MWKLYLYRLFEFCKLIFYRNKELILDFDYDKYWDDKRGLNLGNLSNFQKVRLNIISKFIKKNLSIKDIGSGDGSSIVYLNQKKFFSSIMAYDISHKVISFLKKNKINAKLININKTNFNLLSITDYTLALEVIEHIPNSEKMILDLLKTTNKKLFLSIPNTGYFPHRLRLLFGKFPLQWRLNPNEHLRFWTYSDMNWTLKKLNLLNKSKIILYEGLPVLNKLFPSLFSQGMIVIINRY